MSTAKLHPVRTTDRAPRAAVEGPLRLTRRGRMVVVIACLGLLFGAFVAFGPSVIATDEAGPAPATVTVHPGDTLWDIAGRVNSDGDVRDVVDDILEMNGIDDAGDLQIGSELAVPIQ